MKSQTRATRDRDSAMSVSPPRDNAGQTRGATIPRNEFRSVRIPLASVAVSRGHRRDNAHWRSAAVGKFRYIKWGVSSSEVDAFTDRSARRRAAMNINYFNEIL